MNETPATFRANCPRCGTKSVAFEILKEWKIPNDYDYHYSSVQWDTFAVCSICNRGIVATFVKLQTNDSSPTDLLKQGRSISPESTAPPTPETKVPLHTPEKVGNYYKQGMNSLERKDCDAAGAMFRTALEAAMKEKFSDGEGTLYDRIAEAEKDGDLTPDMAKWAQQIRRLGNDAVHAEEPFSAKEARELQAFTDLFFRYIFTLPGMLEKATKERETRGKPAESENEE